MINIDGDPYLDVGEAADRLGVKPATLYAYVSRGLLRSYKQGIRRRRLYLRSEVDALLALRAPEASLPGDPAPAASEPVADAAQPPRLASADAWAAER